MTFWDNIVAFLTSALAAMGVGGGGLFVIYLTLIKNTEQLTAQGINLFFFIVGAFPGLIVHIFKRKLNFFVIALISVFGVLGVFLGTFLLNDMPTDIVRKAFGTMLFISGAISLLKKK